MGENPFVCSLHCDCGRTLCPSAPARVSSCTWSHPYHEGSSLDRPALCGPQTQTPDRVSSCAGIPPEDLPGGRVGVAEKIDTVYILDRHCLMRTDTSCSHYCNCVQVFFFNLHS